ncbi:MAG TPA: hypothetical protein VFR93_03555, partial [Candidatus Limnocylindrales bacterium]|nr:hypothetical protein [Candidatus Limnocylindrales bacterium]
MRIRDWDEAGLAPAFGHEGHWMMELLDEMDLREIAAYCLPAARGRRLLVATDLGLVDASVEDPPVGPDVEVELVPWPDVTEIRLVALVGLDDALRHVPTYSLRVGRPTIDVTEAPNDAAVLSFGRALVLRAGRPPQVL